MNSTLQKLLPAIEQWPDEDQEALAEAAREIEARRTGVYSMSKEEEAAVAEGLAQAERGDFETLRTMIVRLTRRAEADLEAILDYLERRSPGGASIVAAGLRQTIEV